MSWFSCSLCGHQNRIRNKKEIVCLNKSRHKIAHFINSLEQMVKERRDKNVDNLEKEFPHVLDMISTTLWVRWLMTSPVMVAIRTGKNKSRHELTNTRHNLIPFFNRFWRWGNNYYRTYLKHSFLHLITKINGIFQPSKPFIFLWN